MQTQLDLSNYTNSAGWEVVHDGDTGLYGILNAKGKALPGVGVFTNRVFADQHLAAYLEDCQDNAVKASNAKRAKKEQAA